MFWIAGVFSAAFDSGIEWLLVKGIANYADNSCAKQNAKSWRQCASVMAASLVMHILSNPTVFCSLPHYKGNFDKPQFCFVCLFSVLLCFSLCTSTSKNAVKTKNSLRHRESYSGPVETKVSFVKRQLFL